MKHFDKQEISIITSCFNEMLHSVQHDALLYELLTLQTFN